MKAGRATLTNGSSESTVYADVESMKLDGVDVRVYDCAGQVLRYCGDKCYTLG